MRSCISSSCAAIPTVVETCAGHGRPDQQPIHPISAHSHTAHSTSNSVPQIPTNIRNSRIYKLHYMQHEREIPQKPFSRSKSAGSVWLALEPKDTISTTLLFINLNRHYPKIPITNQTPQVQKQPHVAVCSSQSIANIANIDIYRA